eukprot:Amastigsp_a518394_3.p3 type:complete len:103 gc:universal Amastigsp_a518394_3:390-82(-)
MPQSCPASLISLSFSFPLNPYLYLFSAPVLLLLALPGVLIAVAMYAKNSSLAPLTKPSTNSIKLLALYSAGVLLVRLSAVICCGILLPLILSVPLAQPPSIL